MRFSPGSAAIAACIAIALLSPNLSCAGGAEAIDWVSAREKAAVLGYLGAEAWGEDLGFLLSSLEARHPNPYHATSRAAFLEALHRPEPEGADPGDLASFRVATLCRALALIGEGHTAPVLDLAPTPFLPIAANRHGADLYLGAVGAAPPGGPDPGLGRFLGKRIVAIGGLGWAEAFGRISAFIGAENPGWALCVAQEYLRRKDILVAAGIAGAGDKAVEISCDLGGGEVARIQVPFVGPEAGLSEGGLNWLEARKEVAETLSRRSEAYWFQPAPEKRSVYFQYNSCRLRGDYPIDAFMGDLLAAGAGADKLVLDLRYNSGGDSGIFTRSILPRIAASKFNAPGKLLVLIGPRVYSSGLFAVRELDLRTAALFLGEPTGQGVNHYGMTGWLVLPRSGLVATISTRYWNLDPADPRPSFEPSIPLVLDPALLYAEGRDSVAEAALDYGF